VRLISFTVTACIFLSTQGSAQIVQSCTEFGQASLDVVAPVTENSRDFANGKTNISVISNGDDKGKLHVLVMSPPYDDAGFPTCQVISDITNTGFKKVLMPMLEVEYDPTTGLKFDLPVEPMGEEAKTVRLMMTLNQANGKLDALFSGF